MAAAALIAWPVVTLILFIALGPARGLIWSVSVGYLFLPEAYGFDLPGLPPLKKGTVLSLGLLPPALLYWTKVDRVPVAAPFFRFSVLSCLTVLLLGSFATVGTNTETLVNGPVVRNALSSRDAISMMSDIVLWLVPFLLAWRFLRKPKHHREVLIAVVALGLIYTLPVLFELRMSPQLNNWIYGYFPHSWTQHVRGGGYRPIVFLRHGLWVGFFLFSVALAAMALSREKVMVRPLWILAGIWCFVVLVLSRNLGATLLAVAFLPVVLAFGLKMQIRVASIAALVLLSYPLLSQASLTPATKLLETIQPLSPERAQSLQFRLDNEHLLLERALEKPTFGWGGWNRQRVFDERGRDQTITDGLWIIIIGTRGWVGYLAFFGLLTLPILFLLRASRRKEITPAISGMSLIMAGNYIYMIPNSTLSPIAFLMLGAVAAYVLYGAAENEEPSTPIKPEREGSPRYTRFENRTNERVEDKKAESAVQPLTLRRKLH